MTSKGNAVRRLLGSISVHGRGCPCHSRVRPLSKSIHKQVLPFRHHVHTTTIPPPRNDVAFEMSASSIRYGLGVTSEVGMDMAFLKAKHVAVFTDPYLASLPDSPLHIVLQSLRDAKVPFTIYDRVRCEPTDTSFKEAINFLNNPQILPPFTPSLSHYHPYPLPKVDAFIAVGGGSVLDTSKAANLYTTYPTEDFLDYVNIPIGKGTPVPGPLKPLIAIPTTAGTGSEATGIAIFDYEKIGAKTGIASRYLKPTLGIVDPNNTKTLPFTVAVASGFDQLCHSLESYTALSFDKRPHPKTPAHRPAYQGSNPISDIWALQSLSMINQWLPIAVENPENIHARSQVMLAATYAGIGFGSAGVHLCHGMSYPVSSLVKSYRPEGYPTGKHLGEGGTDPIIPHGMSVVLNAPAVFRFTAVGNPERHRKCAQLMGADVDKVSDEDIGKVLSDRIVPLMKKLQVPNGLKAIGFDYQDIPNLVQGAIPQDRVIKLSPIPVDERDLAKLFEQSMTIY